MCYKYKNAFLLPSLIYVYIVLNSEQISISTVSSWPVVKVKIREKLPKHFTKCADKIVLVDLFGVHIKNSTTLSHITWHMYCTINNVIYKLKEATAIFSCSLSIRNVLLYIIFMLQYVCFIRQSQLLQWSQIHKENIQVFAMVMKVSYFLVFPW